MMKKLTAIWIDSHGPLSIRSKHIPGALHFDLDAGISRTQFIPRNLPEPAFFQQYVRGLGIGADSNVVCYDRDDGVIMQTTGAPRTRFTFKVSK